MLKGVSLQDLARKIEANKGAKRDFIMDTRRITMQVPPRDIKVEPVARPVLEIEDTGAFPVQPLVNTQIAERTGIPAKYYDRMLTKAPDLLATNVNAWFRINPELRMIRTINGSSRAFLSNRYQRIENEAVAEVALNVLSDLPGVQVPSCEVTDKRLYIHFVVPTVQGEVKVGDVVQAGGIISNSEVGLGAVSVSGLIWRLRCLNGAKTSDAFRRHHVGRAVDESGDITWSEDTQKADDQTVLLKVRDMVRAVVDETRFKANLARMQGLATEARIGGDPAKVVELASQRLELTEGERGGILRSLIEGGDLSAWGVVNAVTAQAHSAQSYDRAVELEAAGGRLLELAPTEWKELLQAA